MSKKIMVKAPASLFLNAVKHKIIDGIPFENSFDMYKKKGYIKETTSLCDFLETCSVVFLSHMIQTKEMIGTHNSVNTYFKIMMTRAEIKYDKLIKEVANARETNS